MESITHTVDAHYASRKSALTCGDALCALQIDGQRIEDPSANELRCCMCQVHAQIRSYTPPSAEKAGVLTEESADIECIATELIAHTWRGAGKAIKLQRQQTSPSLKTFTFCSYYTPKELSARTCVFTGE